MVAKATPVTRAGESEYNQCDLVSLSMLFNSQYAVDPKANSAE